MIEPTLDYLDEPRLTFAHGQKMEDPRDGLTLFGPFTKEKHKGPIRVGIIGPAIQRGYVLRYLMDIHKPIKSVKADVARPFFPGLEAIFDVHVNFQSVEEIDVPIDEVNEYLKYTDSHQRVFNLTNLYSERLNKFVNEEHHNVTVWFIAIPDDIYRFGKPKSKIPWADDNQTVGLSKRERQSNQMFLFDAMNEEKEVLKAAYDFEINFHNQLKAKLLNDKIVTQIIRESTIAYDRIWTDTGKIAYERLFDTAKAWNIATTLYYKSGGIPWKLGEVRKKVCYLGLVYKQIDMDENRNNACCAAQMFLDSGDGMVFRGNIGPWYNQETKEFHISKNDAFELLNLSLEAFKEKSDTGEYPDEIFIHAKTNFDDEEWQGFLEACEGKCNIIGVRIKGDSSFKLYRDFSYCVPRGTVLYITNTFAYLWTKGFIPRIQTQLGLETPNPISVEVVRGDKDIQSVCKDILALTKLNYNACIFADGFPVTLRFAESIGEVLTAGKDIKSEVLPFKHYV